MPDPSRHGGALVSLTLWHRLLIICLTLGLAGLWGDARAQQLPLPDRPPHQPGPPARAMTRLLRSLVFVAPSHEDLDLVAMGRALAERMAESGVGLSLYPDTG